MATTKIQTGAFPADVVTTAAIDDLSITHAKLHTTMDLSSKTVTLPTLSTLNTTGNVGIGTVSPLRKIHISDPGDTHLVLQSTNATNDYEIFEMGVGANSNSKVDLTFRTRNNSGTGGSEVMRLSNDGDVHLNSGVDVRIQLGTSGTGATSVSDNSVYVRGNDDDLILGAAGNGNIFFKENAATHMTIETGGNVGIGTTNPSYPLHISGPGHKRLKIEKTDAGGDADLQISSPNDSTGWVLFHDNNSGNNSGVIKYVHSTNKMHFRTNDVDDRLVISSDGNVGIGTDSPGAKLDVRGSMNLRLNNGLLFFTDNNTAGATNVNGGFIGMAHNAGHHVTSGDGGFGSNANSLVIGNYHTGGGDIILATTNAGPYVSGRVIIKESGNVGIGTDNPNSVSGYRTLHIRGTSGSLIDMGASGTDSRIVGDTNGLGFEVSTGSHSNQNIRWKAGTIIGALDSHMLLNSSGNLGINKTAPSAKLHVVDSVSDTISAANAVVKIDGTGGDGLSFGNTQSSPYSSWMQAGYLADSYSPAFNNGYPILINPIGGNVMIGSNVPNSYLHIDKRTSDNTTGRSQFQIRADGSGARAERIKRITYCYRPGYNQYTFHRIKLGGGVYGAGQTIRYRVTFTTGHASGHGFVEGVISLYAHHSTTKMHLTGHTKYLRHYSNGSYYGWTSNPDVDFFFSNNTNANACVIMRVQGHGNHNSNTFDLICDHHIDLEIHGSDHSTNTECTQIGHSAPADMSTVFSSSTLS